MSRWHIPVRIKRFWNGHSDRISRPLFVAILFGIIGSLFIYFGFAARGYDEDYNVQLPPITPNPTVVTQSCVGGLAIAIVADTSGSIYNNPSYVQQMKTALDDFVSGLLPSTKTFFSLTQFSGDGSILQPFTGNVTAITSAIDGMRGGSDTNWLAGLQTGYSSFGTAPTNMPRVLMIATDGDPTEPRGSALLDAVNEANIIKGANVHILVVGIGRDLNVSNMQAISGNNVNTGGINSDVITTDFSTLNSALQSVATSSCSGTGNGGNGNGNGGTGNGNGVGGTGTGSNGKGTGTNGSGTGTIGTGKGTAGTTPQPSPTPTPSAANGTTPSPAPTPEPSPDPTPAPTATQAPEPNPAPTPTAQGIQVTPPETKPSPFYDGKQYTAGSTNDNFTYTPPGRSLKAWLVGGLTAAVVLGGGGFYWWKRKHKAPAKPLGKRK